MHCLSAMLLLDDGATVLAVVVVVHDHVVNRLVTNEIDWSLVAAAAAAAVRTCVDNVGTLVALGSTITPVDR